MIVFLLFLYILVVLNSQNAGLNTPMVISLAIPLSLLIVPYNWAYDQILLVIPITFITGRLIQFPAREKIIAWLFPYFIDVLAITLLIRAYLHGIDVWSLLLPGIITVIIFFFVLDDRKNRLVRTNIFL